MLIPFLLFAEPANPPEPFRLLPDEARQIVFAKGYRDAASIYEGEQWIAADPLLNQTFIRRLVDADAAIRYDDLLLKVPAEKRPVALKLIQARNLEAIQVQAEMDAYSHWAWRQKRSNDERLKLFEEAQGKTSRRMQMILPRYLEGLARELGEAPAKALLQEERATGLVAHLRPYGLDAAPDLCLRLCRIAVASADEVAGDTQKFLPVYVAKVQAAGFSPAELEWLKSFVLPPPQRKVKPGEGYSLSGSETMASASDALHIPEFWGSDRIAIPVYPTAEKSR